MSTLPQHPVMSNCPCVGNSNYSAMLVLLSSHQITNPEKKVWATPTDNQSPVLPVYELRTVSKEKHKKIQSRDSFTKSA